MSPAGSWETSCLDQLLHAETCSSVWVMLTCKAECLETNELKWYIITKQYLNYQVCRAPLPQFLDVLSIQFNILIAHMIANMNEMCFLRVSASYWISIRLLPILHKRKRKRMWGVNLVSACVSWSGAFSIRAFEYCCLLWCNAGATDKSELMNGKLLLMIVKMRLSPHAVLGHLSATGWSYSPRHASHTLISCFLVAMATKCSVSFPVPLCHFSPFSLSYSHPFCFLS